MYRNKGDRIYTKRERKRESLCVCVYEWVRVRDTEKEE